MKRPRDKRDEEIRGEIAKALDRAIRKSKKSRDEVAALLGIEVGTLSKYLTNQMIPGGHVLWRACKALDMVLDSKGLRLATGRDHKRHKVPVNQDQYELPFIDEVLAGDKVHLTIGRKGPQKADYVSVTLKIKVAN